MGALLEPRDIPHKAQSFVPSVWGGLFRGNNTQRIGYASLYGEIER